MIRPARAMIAAQLAATVSLLALTSAQAQSAATTELEQVTVQATTEKGDGPVEGYIAERSVSGTKTDTPLIETPQSISVVPKDQIEDQGATSVSEALRYTPGVAAEYRGSSNFHDEMYIRGFGYVPRYVNGLEFGWSSLGKINPYLLERVEVLKGPASILYGQANPGGIVNLTTKKPTGETAREAEITVGTNNQVGVGFDIQGVFDPAAVWSYRLVGQADRADLVEDGLIEQGGVIAPSLRWAPDADTALTLVSFYSHEPDAGYRNFREAAGTLYATSYGYIPDDFLVGDKDYDEYRRTQAQIGYDFEHRINETFKVRQNVAYNIIDTYHQTLTWGALQADEETITRTASGGSTDLNQFVVDNQLQSEFDTGPLAHTLLSGVDFKHSMRNYQWGYDFTTSSQNWLNPTYGTGEVFELNDRVSDYVTTAWQSGLYLQDQVKFGKLNVQLGARYDYASTEIDNATSSDASYSDSAFTWRAGAIYNFDSGISPYVSYSTSFDPSLSVDHNGLPLDPETAQQWEAGVKFETADQRFMVNAALFHILQQNKSSTDPNTNEIFQTGEQRSQGFEVEGRAKVTDSFSLIASYTFVDAEITEDEDASKVGLTPDRLPEQQASIWGKYEFLDGPLDGLALGLGVRHIGESTDRTNTLTVPSVTLLDAMAAYDFGGASAKLDGVKLQLNATNLLDERYTASCASKYACWSGAGRTLTAQLKYTW